MADFSVTELMPLINQQADAHDLLSMKLDQVYALAYVSTAWPDFIDDPLIAAHYLEALHSLIDEASEIYKKLEVAFSEMRRLLPIALISEPSAT